MARPACAALTGASGHWQISVRTLLFTARVRHDILGRDGKLMSETIKPTIAALRAWLKTCPLIADEQEATGAAFRIAGLEEESTAFSIEDSPGDPIITEYISGWEMAKNYLFLSRREYSEMDAVSIQNSGFFEQLTEWVMQQDARHNLPDLSACGGGKTPTGIAVTNSGYIVTNSAGSCKMQLQMRLTYYMPKRKES